MERWNTKWLPIGAAVLFAAGCSATPDALERARADFVKAHQQPQVSANAPVALHQAAESLRHADEAWKQGNEEEATHLAYVTEQRTQIARAVAQQRMAEAEARRLAQEQDEVLLEAREREAERARKLAEARAREAAQARLRAEQSELAARAAVESRQEQERQAKLARQEAQILAQEAESAQLEAAKRAEELAAVKQQAEKRAREAEEARQRAQASAAEVDKLQQELSEFKARQTERGLELTLSGVLFEFDSAQLKPGALRGLEPLVDFLKDNPERRVILEGHTDNVGADAYNQALSQRRAEAVQSYLRQSGIEEAKVTVRGLGETYPVASNQSEAGRLQNRRVEIIILNEPPAQSAKSDAAGR